MTDDKMREAFEVHVSPEFPRWDKDRLYMRQEDGNYWNWQVQGYWRMWQAAAAQQAQEIEALRADAWDRKDTARLDWLINELRERDMRRIGIDTLAGGIAWTRVAIDAAMHKDNK